MAEEKKIKDVHLHLKCTIPLFEEVVVHLVVTHDIQAAHKALNVEYHHECSRTGGETHWEDRSLDVYLFIEESSLTHEWLGHELSHVTNDVAAIAGIKAKRNNDEADARIAGFLHGWVYKQLEKAGKKITHK